MDYKIALDVRVELGMTRIVSVQNKLLDFMSLQIKNMVFWELWNSKINICYEKYYISTCPSNKISKPRVK